jgi:hypothetical protein
MDVVILPTALSIWRLLHPGPSPEDPSAPSAAPPRKLRMLIAQADIERGMELKRQLSPGYNNSLGAALLQSGWQPPPPPSQQQPAPLVPSPNGPAAPALFNGTAAQALHRKADSSQSTSMFEQGVAGGAGPAAEADTSGRWGRSAGEDMSGKHSPALFINAVHVTELQLQYVLYLYL